MKKLLIFFTVALPCFIFTACGDEDEYGELTQSDLTPYKWMTDVDYDVSIYDDGGNITRDRTVLYFEPSGRGLSVWYHKGVNSYYGEDSYTGYESFSYSISGNSITVKYDESSKIHSQTLCLHYDKKNQQITGAGTFYRTNRTSADYELIKKNMSDGKPWYDFSFSLSYFCMNNAGIPIGNGTYQYPVSVHVQLPSGLKKKGLSTFGVLVRRTDGMSIQQSGTKQDMHLQSTTVSYNGKSYYLLWQNVGDTEAKWRAEISLNSKTANKCPSLEVAIYKKSSKGEIRKEDVEMVKN